MLGFRELPAVMKAAQGEACVLVEGSETLLSFTSLSCRAGIILSGHISDVLGEMSPKHTIGSCGRGDFQPVLAKHPCFKPDFGARE